MSAISYREDIDGLRALAVLGVVLYHVDSAVLPGGFLGVDIFFSISGYLISLILFREIADGTFSFGGFYARRVKRLFPALFVVLAFVLLFGAFALFPEEYMQLGQHAYQAIVFTINFGLIKDAGYFDTAADFKPLLHLWSLSVEEQFYLIWPIALLALARFRIRPGALFGAMAAASLAFAVYLAQTNADALYYHPLARFWELLGGAMLAYWHSRRNAEFPQWSASVGFLQNVVSVVGLAMLAGSLACLDSESPHPGVATLIPVLGAAAVIASGRGAVGNRLLAWKPLVWIGLISYPLYLWHWPILSYLRIMESGTPDGWLLWAGGASSVLLAWGTYHYIERPVRRSALGASRRPVVALVVAMCGLFMVAKVGIAADGLPGRPSVHYVKAAKAQMKREPRQDASCAELFRPGEAPVYCRQHNPGAKMVGIIGDSHAHVLFPGLAEIAEQKGYGTILLANSGCPPLRGTATGRNGAERAECNSKVDRILRAIESDSRVSIVVIATRGARYITGQGYGPAESKKVRPPITNWSLKELLPDATPAEIFERGLGNTIDEIVKTGKRVVYVLQVPELGIPPRDCLGRPLVIVHERRCDVPRETYRSRMAEYRIAVEHLHTGRTNFAVVDPADLLCDEERCYGTMGRDLLYADDNHLSVYGSRVIAPLIGKTMGL